MRFLPPVRYLCLTSALLLATGTVGAQGRKTGTLTGVVLDERGVPVPNVEVAITKLARNTRTDAAGKYLLALLPSGSYDVVYRRLSYAPMVFILEISDGDTTEASVKMNAVPQEMNTVLIEEAPERSRDLGGFEQRRKAGFGHFITREQIVERDPLLLSDMVRMIPGAKLLPAGFGRSQLRFSRAQGARDCPPTYFLDGVMATGFNIDDIMPVDVEAVEFYSGISTLPAQFAKARSTITCGTVVIWTRIPGNPKKKK
jgi:hypothetical protein